MRFYFLATAVLPAILIGACAEEPVFKTESLASLKPSLQVKEASVGTNNHKSASKLKQYESRLKGLTDSEKAEWIILNEKRQTYTKEYQKKVTEWRKSNPATRGNHPNFVQTPDRTKTISRLSELELKVNKAKVPDKYKSLHRNILTRHEIDELIALEIESLEFQFQKTKEYQRLLKAGSQEEAVKYLHSKSNTPRSPRMVELQSKIRNAKQVENRIKSIQRESRTYKVNFPQSNIEQLRKLEIEKQAIQQETNKLRHIQSRQWQTQRSYGGGQVFSAFHHNEDIQKNQARIREIDAQIRAFRTPLDTAIQANRTRANITRLSQKYDIVLLSSEIEELVELTAEQQKLQSELRNQTYSKSSTYGSSTYGNNYGSASYGNASYGNSFGTPTYSNKQQYHARLKEITTRITAIKAPINEAQKAERDARRYSRPLY